jgi:hypothetical protein
MDSGTVSTNPGPVTKVAGHSPNARMRRRMEYRTLGRTGTEGGDAPLDDKRQSGL